jgi:hypothetical protein
MNNKQFTEQIQLASERLKYNQDRAEQLERKAWQDYNGRIKNLLKQWADEHAKYCIGDRIRVYGEVGIIIGKRGTMTQLKPGISYTYRVDVEYEPIHHCSEQDIEERLN